MPFTKQEGLNGPTILDFEAKLARSSPAPRHARIPRRILVECIERDAEDGAGTLPEAMPIRGIAGTAHGGGAHARAREPALVQDHRGIHARLPGQD